VDKSKSEAAQGRVRAESFQEENSMSSPIQPTQGATPANAPLSGGTSRRVVTGFSMAPTTPGRAVSLDTLPASPPQQVLEEMATAARVHDGLRAMGRELHFAHDENSGRMTIEVRDNGGNVLRTISPAQALDVAAGKPLE
jgi:hypothetical protein